MALIPDRQVADLVPVVAIAGNDGSGGGGGSGYSNGEVEIITNGLGGNQSTQRFRMLRFTDNDVCNF